MDLLLEALNDFVIQILGIVLTGLAGWVSIKVNQLIKKKEVSEVLEQQRGIIKIVVRFVEQSFHELNGAQKLEKARAESLVWLNSLGLKITEQQLNLIIESAVHELTLTTKEVEGSGTSVTLIEAPAVHDTVVE